MAVAPMMAWTDRHCRYLLRLTARRALLFTEMVTAHALEHGPADALLAFHPAEHPIALQLGGSEPELMAAAAERGVAAGFDEININVGCPSARVSSGRFGACLMLEPDRVARIAARIRAVTDVPVTVKCRLGVDAHDTQPLLETFVEQVADAGSRRFYVHARKALLNGLSPAQNRQIPPLQYERVYALKARYPELDIILNGGVETTDAAIEHLQQVDGVMIGRRAYQQPLFMNDLTVNLLGESPCDVWTVMNAYRDYMARELERGTRISDMTRHCLGLFAGQPGARRFRRVLSDQQRLKRNDLTVVDEALDALRARAA